jgi:hypothetical protein
MRLPAILSVLASDIGISPATAPDLVYVPDSTKKICRLAGDFDRAAGVPTLSQTNKRFGFAETDLRSSFEHKGKLYFLFGDTNLGDPNQESKLWSQKASICERSVPRVSLSRFFFLDHSTVSLTNR